MFLKFKSVDGARIQSSDASDEICTFKGIRYDPERHLAILSSEQSGFEYLMPMDSTNYAQFVDSLYTMAAMALMRPGIKVCIKGGYVIRARDNGNKRYDSISGCHYELEADRELVS